LSIGKVYKLLPATETERKSGLLRVIDNEGEDYLYDADYFQPVATEVAAEEPTAVMSAFAD